MTKTAKDKTSKRWIIAIIIFAGFFLLYTQYTKSPSFLGSIGTFGIFNVNVQPTSCFEFNQKTYCPGDPEFLAVFSCNREGMACPEGMVCNPDGMCGIKQPETSYAPILIVGLVLLAWVIRKGNQ